MMMSIVKKIKIKIKIKNNIKKKIVASIQGKRGIRSAAAAPISCIKELQEMEMEIEEMEIEEMEEMEGLGPLRCGSCSRR